jgi:hypothetical protein
VGNDQALAKSGVQAGQGLRNSFAAVGMASKESLRLSCARSPTKCVI